MQLVMNTGPADGDLTGDPSITFWNLSYSRHTNFAMESIEQIVSNAGFGNKVSVLVSRNADMLFSGYLELDLPVVAVANLGNLLAGAAEPVWVNNIATRVIQECSVDIGGQQIDRQYGEWMQIWNELSVSDSRRNGLNTMTGASDVSATAAVTNLGLAAVNSALVAKKVLCPLPFWFNRNPGLSLPLVALQYHDIRINITFRNFNDVIRLYHPVTGAAVQATTGTTPALGAKLWLDYVYLSSPERTSFKDAQSEYLIEQVQQNQGSGAQSDGGATVTLKMEFNHPVKELVFFWRRAVNEGSAVTAVGTEPNRDNFTSGAGGAYLANTGLSTANISFNGSDRVATRDTSYFTELQPYAHHTRVPRLPGIHCYSFALRPEDHQPSGSANFSRIDNAQLKLVGNAAGNPDYTPYVYAVNYNILRIASGMGGLAYSN
jgi:hypothetical protein